MSPWHWIDMTGYAASALVFCAFYMRGMTALRAVAIASNLTFIAYGIGRELYPVLVLHAVLLPLNCLRLFQDRRSGPGGSAEVCSLTWLTPVLSRQACRAGDVLFGAGEPARSMFLVLRGSVRIAETGLTFGPGALIGELGVLAPGSVRSGTAVCATDGEIGSISAERVREICRRDALFCLCLAMLVAEPTPAASVAPLRPRAEGRGSGTRPRPRGLTTRGSWRTIIAPPPSWPPISTTCPSPSSPG